MVAVAIIPQEQRILEVEEEVMVTEQLVIEQVVQAL